MFLGGEFRPGRNWAGSIPRRVGHNVGYPSIAQMKEQTSSKRQVPGLNPGGRSANESKKCRDTNYNGGE